jgi:hypothetical protein
MRTEHSGAKNGGGYWGTRTEAKRISKKARRAAGRDRTMNDSHDQQMSKLADRLVEQDAEAEAEGCLRDHGRGECRGVVSFRWTDAGSRIAECSHHMAASLERNAETRERYPDSPIAPGWFDEADAGERWDDDY